MGVSTDGIVFYGFSIDDESDEMERLREADEDSDPLDIVAKVYGWDGKNPEYSFQWEKLHPSPVTIGIHCSYDYSMYYIAISETLVKASRGYPKFFTPITKPEYDRLIREFCEKAGLKVPEKIGWMVTSLWG